MEDTGPESAGVSNNSDSPADPNISLLMYRVQKDDSVRKVSPEELPLLNPGDASCPSALAGDVDSGREARP